MSAWSARLEEQLRDAVRHFWVARGQQASKQREDVKDRGERGSVTGGKQMDGFIRLTHDLLIEAGLTSASVFCRAREQPATQLKKRGTKRQPGAQSTQTKLPGWFRAEQDWDLVVVVGGSLIAAIEFKSQVGPSFGNNFNNRTEEALGNATDLWATYREGAFKPSLRPWVGYLMLLEEAPASLQAVKSSEPHFRVFEEFREASYARRYEILLTKLVRERLYDAACFLLSSRESGKQGVYREPNPELGFRNFSASLLAHAIATAKSQPPPADSARH
jgi:hypothetical protein